MENPAAVVGAEKEDELVGGGGGDWGYLTSEAMATAGFPAFGFPCGTRGGVTPAPNSASLLMSMEHAALFDYNAAFPSSSSSAVPAPPAYHDFGSGGNPFSVDAPPFLLEAPPPLTAGAGGQKGGSWRPAVGVRRRHGVGRRGRAGSAEHGRLLLGGLRLAGECGGRRAGGRWRRRQREGQEEGDAGQEPDGGAAAQEEAQRPPLHAALRGAQDQQGAPAEDQRSSPELESAPSSAALGGPSTANTFLPSTPTLQPFPGRIKEERCPPAPFPSPSGQQATVEVRMREGQAVNIHMFCARRPGILLSTMRALDSLGLDIEQAVISCFDGFAMDVFRAEQCREGPGLLPEEIKAVLLHCAGLQTAM
ncbi:hypothetical protein ZWY2020_027362 [Hordeum vulgare]|nr:hypothetical protein ZWY2020_027362 [Hordeum vulgare]